MKNLLLIIFTVGMYSCSSEQYPEKKSDRILSFNQIVENFPDPPSNYRTIPFWVWNEKVTKEMIDEQLPDFKDKGFGGVFIHPRYGLITNYLSDDWHDLVRYAADRAMDLGLELWLYDENSFPSGFAGGHVPDRMPDSYRYGVAMRRLQMEMLDPDPAREWIGFYYKEKDVYKEITRNISDYTGKKGEFIGVEKIFGSPTKWYAGFTYVDLLYPGVTEKFIEVTMEGYEKNLGEYFGSIVPGIFTDEPNINPGNRDNLRWTPDLFEVFKNTWGYDLRENLVSLFEETGEWRKVRHNYYSVLLDLFIERWSVPWNNYTEEKGLNWTGHYWEHGWPNPVHGGDNMAMYPYHQVPGIDMLFNTQLDRPDQFGNIRAVKELASVANQFGRSRTLSETYGASGYELNFEDMKRNGDWLYALGVNFMNQHLSYQSMLGDRKHDFPQTFSYHTPWWDAYRSQADYFARLSLALSSGYQKNDFLVIEPTTSAWMHYSTGRENPEMDLIGQEFNRFIDTIEYLKLEYDLASEKTMRDFGSSRDGRITIDQKSYSTLILPYGIENIDASTFDLIKEFLATGGKMYSFGSTPKFINGQPTDQVLDLFSSFNEQVITTEEISGSGLTELPVSKELTFDPLSGAKNVYFMRRQFEEGDLIFLANFENGSTHDFSLHAAKKQDVIELDPVTGKIFEKEFKKMDDGITLSITLEDAGSKLFFLSKKKIKTTYEMRPEWIPEEKEDLFISGIQRHDDNIIPLDYCFLEFPGEKNRKDELLYFYTAHDRIFQKHGFPDNPWVSSSQFKTGIIDRDTFSMNSGFKAIFPVFIHEGVELQGISLVVERPELFRVLVNGKLLLPGEGEFYLDKGTGVYHAGEALKTGKNEIELIAQPFSVFHELAPVFLKGNFSVQPAGKGWEIAREISIDLGSWKDFGLPFYPAGVSYLTRFTMNVPLEARLKLEKWGASCLEVSINNSDKVLLWPPYELDISPWLKEGENSLEIIVTGSLKNLVGPHHNVRVQGLVTPWSFKYAPDSQPPGSEYSLMNYGLYSPPVLLKRASKLAKSN